MTIIIDMIIILILFIITYIEIYLRLIFVYCLRYNFIVFLKWIKDNLDILSLEKALHSVQKVIV